MSDNRTASGRTHNRALRRELGVLGGRIARPADGFDWDGPALSPSSMTWRGVGVPQLYLDEWDLAGRFGRRTSQTWIRPSAFETSPPAIEALVGASADSPLQGSPAPAADERDKQLVVCVDVGTTKSELDGIVDLIGQAGVVIFGSDGPWLTGLPRLGSDELRAPLVEVERATQDFGFRLDQPQLEHLVRVANGSQPVIEGILRASIGLGRDRTWSLVDGATSANQLIAKFTSALIEVSRPSRVEALILAACLGYAHESMSGLAPALDQPEHDPWWDVLTSGWYRVRPIWQRALLAVGAPQSESFDGRVARLIGHLESESLPIEAIDLITGIRSSESSNRLLSEIVESIGDRASRRTYAAWLRTVPPAVRSELAISGELDDLPIAEAAGDDLQHALAESTSETLRALARGKLAMGAAWAQVAQRIARKVPDRGARENASRLGRLAKRASRIHDMEKRIHRSLDVTANALNTYTSTPLFPGSTPGPLATHAPARGSVSGIRGERPSSRLGPVLTRGWVAGARALEVGLLGPLVVTYAGRRVVEWSGELGRSILGLIVTQYPRAINRDHLLSVFWPDVPGRSASNRLHVALHALRSDLTQVSSNQIIVYRDHHYGLSRSITLATDTQAVADHVKEARQAESYDGDAAVTHYEAALALFRGEYCEDCRYDEWAIPDRERYRMERLDILERLCQLYLAIGRYTDTVEATTRLLALDSCHESGHRLKMLAHARLNQPHLAIRQFEACERELQAELAMSPALATKQLVEAIRRRQDV